MGTEPFRKAMSAGDRKKIIRGYTGGQKPNPSDMLPPPPPRKPAKK